MSTRNRSTTAARRGRALTRAARAAETKEAILETAAQLFLRSGIEGTSLDAVAAELGLTKGAVYANFPSKAALVEAVATANSSPKTMFDPLLDPNESLAKRVRAFGEKLVATKISQQMVLLDLEYVIYAARNHRWDQAARDEFRSGVEDLAKRFRAANAASGEQTPISEERFLVLLNLLGRGLIQELALHPGSLSPEDIGAMFRMLVQSPAGSRGTRDRRQ